jgi:hypothetical protein
VEPVWIKEFKRFFRITAVVFEIQVPQFGTCVIGIEVRDAEMVDPGDGMIPLLNTKKEPPTPRMWVLADCCLSGIPKKDW